MHPLTRSKSMQSRALRASSLAVLACGVVAATSASCAREPDEEHVGSQSSALVGAWSTAATTMGVARAAFTSNCNALSTTTGLVLFAGGSVVGGASSTQVETYGENGFVVRGPLPVGRAQGGAIALDDGAALIAGGGAPGAPFVAVANIDRFTVGTNWTPAGSLQAGRFGPLMTRLADGRILIVGGVSNGGNPTATPPTGILASAELYNPTTTVTTLTTGSLLTGRFFHLGGLLANGKVAIIGGFGATNIAVYDPTAQTFTDGPAVQSVRWSAAAARLPDGKILYCGGCGGALPCEGAALASCEIFDGTTVTATGSMTQSSGMFSMITMATGKVLAVGGVTNGGTVRSRAEIYDPATGQWTATGSLATGRYEAGIGLLANGHVVYAGGRTGPTLAGSTYLNTAEIYEPATATMCKVQQVDGTTVTLANATVCDDSNPCTTSDVCTSGVCGGTAVTNGTVCMGGTCQAGACVSADAGSATDANDAAPGIDASKASDASDASPVSDTGLDASDVNAPDASDATTSDASDAIADTMPDVVVTVDTGVDVAQDAPRDVTPTTPDTSVADTGGGNVDGGTAAPDSGCQCQTTSVSRRTPDAFGLLMGAVVFFGAVRRRISRVSAKH